MATTTFTLMYNLYFHRHNIIHNQRLYFTFTSCNKHIFVVDKLQNAFSFYWIEMFMVGTLLWYLDLEVWVGGRRGGVHISSIPTKNDTDAKAFQASKR